MDDNFVKAFDLIMESEVGPWFNSADPDTISGKMGTKELNRKVGYVNDPDDAGGETKYGVAKNTNPDVNIKELDLATARMIYEKRYWAMNHCDKLMFPVNVIHFDAAVNAGSSRATKLLQMASGCEPVDGSFGPQTLRLANGADPKVIASKLLDARVVFYKKLVEQKPTNAKFLKGWLSRVEMLRDWLKKNA